MEPERIKGPDPVPDINWDAVIYKGIAKFENHRPHVPFGMCQYCRKADGKPNPQCVNHTWKIKKD